MDVSAEEGALIWKLKLVFRFGAMHGLKEVHSKIFAIASKKIQSAVGRTGFVRVKLLCTEKECYAEPIRVSGSGIISSMTKSDGFVIIEEDKEGVEVGVRVGVNVWVW